MAVLDREGENAVAVAGLWRFGVRLFVYLFACLLASLVFVVVVEIGDGCIALLAFHPPLAYVWK